MLSKEHQFHKSAIEKNNKVSVIGPIVEDANGAIKANFFLK